MANQKNRCPECDSPEFISELNRYDVYEFEDDDFVITNTHFLDDYKTYCRNCQEEVDVLASIANKKVTLKS